MRRAALIALAALALATPAYAANAGNPTTDVTTTTTIQHYLTLAQDYWATQNETLPCVERVLITPMTAATGNNGAVIPTTDVWAETVLNQCTIDISANLWNTITQRQDTYAVCTTFSHEMGHSLGLPDTPGPGMMNQNPSKRRDYFCSQAYKRTVAMQNHSDALGG